MGCGDYCVWGMGWDGMGLRVGGGGGVKVGWIFGGGSS